MAIRNCKVELSSDLLIKFTGQKTCSYVCFCFLICLKLETGVLFYTITYALTFSLAYIRQLYVELRACKKTSHPLILFHVSFIGIGNQDLIL